MWVWVGCGVGSGGGDEGQGAIKYSEKTRVINLILAVWLGQYGKYLPLTLYKPRFDQFILPSQLIFSHTALPDG